MSKTKKTTNRNKNQTGIYYVYAFFFLNKSKFMKTSKFCCLVFYLELIDSIQWIDTWNTAKFQTKQNWSKISWTVTCCLTNQNKIWSKWAWNLETLFNGILVNPYSLDYYFALHTLVPPRNTDILTKVPLSELDNNPISYTKYDSLLENTVTKAIDNIITLNSACSTRMS